MRIIVREPSQLASADSWTSVIIAAVRCGALVMVQRREQAGGRIVSKYVQPRALHAPPRPRSDAAARTRVVQQPTISFRAPVA